MQISPTSTARARIERVRQALATVPVAVDARVISHLLTDPQHDLTAVIDASTDTAAVNRRIRSALSHLLLAEDYPETTHDLGMDTYHAHLRQAHTHWCDLHLDPWTYDYDSDPRPEHDVHVTWADGETLADTIKADTAHEALAAACANWPDATITLIDVEEAPGADRRPGRHRVP